MILNIPKSEIVICSMAGSIGWISYYLLSQSYSIYISTFFAVIIISSLSRVLAVKRKMPYTVFAVPSIIPIVPGGGIYSTIYMISVDNPEAYAKGVETLRIAGIIALAIFLVSALPISLFKLK